MCQPLCLRLHLLSLSYCKDIKFEPFVHFGHVLNTVFFLFFFLFSSLRLENIYWGQKLYRSQTKKIKMKNES